MLIGQRIKECREKQGMTQTYLADKVGISKQLLYKYESGQIENLPLERVNAIANVLNTAPACLLGWDDPLEAYRRQKIMERREELDYATNTELEVSYVLNDGRVVEMPRTDEEKDLLTARVLKLLIHMDIEDVKAIYQLANSLAHKN